MKTKGQKVLGKPKIGTRNCKKYRENQSFGPELQKTSGKPKKPKEPKFQTLELQKTSGKPKKHKKKNNYFSDTFWENGVSQKIVPKLRFSRDFLRFLV